MTKNVSRAWGVLESEGSSQGAEKLKHCCVPPTAPTVQGPQSLPGQVRG